MGDEELQILWKLRRVLSDLDPSRRWSCSCG